MLRQEEARERLQQFLVKDGEKRQVERAMALPPDLRAIGCRLLSRSPETGKDLEWDKADEARRQGVAALMGLPAPQRRPVLEALFPTLAAHVERALGIYPRLPYRVDEPGPANHAPTEPGLYAESLGQWLNGLVCATWHYQQDAAWFAAWYPYIEDWLESLPVVLAAAIEAGGPEGKEVYDTLIASAAGEHEIGAMGAHVVKGLLIANCPDGWDYLGKLLLAAQRQEGLRQAILEAADEAHPRAFMHLLRLILDNDLTRFSSVVRALDVWFGYGMEAGDTRAANQVLRWALEFLEDTGARQAALCGTDPAGASVALWAAGYEDSVAATETAARLLGHEAVEFRFVAARTLVGFGHRKARLALFPALEDPDLRVAATALVGISDHAESLADTDLFERLERTAGRFPKTPRKLEPLVWPWAVVQVASEPAYDALAGCIGDRPLSRLLPHLPAMEGYTASATIEQLTAGKRKLDDETRDVLLGVLASPTTRARDAALKALAREGCRTGEAPRLEALLTRKTAELRTGVLGLLLKQPDAGALASAERLLAARDALQRAAGVELLEQMHKAGREREACEARAEAYRASAGKLAAVEEALLAKLVGARAAPKAEATLADALGLAEPDKRTRPAQPRPIEGMALTSPAAEACVRSLADFVKAHRDTPISVAEPGDEPEEALLGNVDLEFPDPDPERPLEEDLPRLPLPELWDEWWTTRPADTRDADGHEALRALLSDLPSRGRLQQSSLVESVLLWMVRLHPAPGVAGFLLDALEDSLARQSVPRDGRGLAGRVLERVTEYRQLCPAVWDAASVARLWRLLRWVDEPVLPAGQRKPARQRPELAELVAALAAGAATEADVYEQLLGPRSRSGAYYREGFNDLQLLTTRAADRWFGECPALRGVVDRCRARVLEVELARGDMPTVATEPAMSLRYAGGALELAAILRAMGSLTFDRSGYYSVYGDDKPGRALVFSHLARVTRPGPGDTPAAFAAAVREAGVPQRKLVDLAVYAPQWARHVEEAVGWPMLSEGAWWLHAHTRDRQWSVPEETRDAWAGEVAERTPLTSQDLLDGAVDVQWFSRVYASLGEERWNALDGAAKYASESGGHKRAQLFADAMRGRLTRDDLIQRIQQSRNQQSVCALGLVPLADGDAREADVLARYEALQEFVRTSRQFGTQRQASEKQAAAIGQQNLARTAGYPDPVRLQWAMELRAVADLAEGPVTASAGDVSVTLSVNALGEPEIVVARAGKPVKDIPPAARKDPAIAALRERKTQIQQQASRVRRSLEDAMCRGDAFTGDELRRLWGHPVLAPMLRSLVFVGEHGMGYPVDCGSFLEAHDGALTPVPLDACLRLAHPHDLLHAGAWEAWQEDCFRRERVQPFKQVFRELYPLTVQERADATVSRRYAGHQVNPRQALALLGSRGWVARPEEGVFRTFHDAGITAAIEFDQYFTTPAEVEGLTTEAVHFTKRGDWEPVPLEEVPPRLFSEVMRDVDLVVSVAHQGGVDPEASASTVEMRAAVIRQTCALLKVTNVRTEGNFALVDGELGHYSVHLGSAGVHRQPGGYVCIVPVHSQHRGRLFLPFVDDDPRTAEVLSKVLLLAKDREIKDPIILQQLLGP